MSRSVPFLVALSLCACPATDDTGDSGPTECDVEIRETYPAADAIDFNYRGTIEVHLNKPNEDGEPTLTLDGVSGEVTSNEEGTTWYFKPDAPLEPLTSYTVGFSYCRGDAGYSFTTSALGKPLTIEPSELTGTVMQLNLEDGRVVIPEGVGAVLEPYLGEVTIFLEVLSADASEITVMGAIADEDTGAQDFCSPSLAFPPADFTASPYFQLGPETLDFEIAGYAATIEDMLLGGTVADDGTWIGGGILRGKVDTRPLVSVVFDDEDDPNAICDFVLGFGVECIDCGSDGTETYCLELMAVDFTASAVDLDLEEIELEDCHLECADTWTDTGALSNELCDLEPVETGTGTETGTGPTGG